MRNRDRLRLQPLGTSRRLALHVNSPSPGKRVAEVDNSGNSETSDDYGWLTELRSGNLIIEHVAGGTRSVDQRKAKAALERLERLADQRDLNAIVAQIKADENSQEAKDRKAAEVAELCRKFSEEVGGDRIAAELLGLPKRTFDNIKQGRGFAYPLMLALAVQAFRSTPDPK